MTSSPIVSATPRLVSLDVFRGLTVAAMILVNNPGSWSHVYGPFGHAKWHGWTPTDLIFPFFLVIAGIAIPLAIGRRVARGDTRRLLARKIVLRSTLIFCVGLFLHGYPEFEWRTLRIPGVLPRIAVVYATSSLLYLVCTWRGLVAIGGSILVAYWAAMCWLPLPDGTPANLDPGTNLAAWVDGKVLAGHMWSQTRTWDPEGVLSTLPAVVSGLIGVLGGIWIESPRAPAARLLGLFAVGSACVAAGLVWGIVFPINKALWTSSFVLLSGGWALIAVATCYVVVDVWQVRWWTPPALAFGMNALVAYVASGLLARSMVAIRWETESGQMESLKGWVFAHGFAAYLPPYVASLAYAICNVLILLPPLWLMYRRKIFVRL